MVLLKPVVLVIRSWGQEDQEYKARFKYIVSFEGSLKYMGL